MNLFLSNLQNKYPLFAYGQAALSSTFLACAQILMKIIHQKISPFYALQLRAIFLFLISFIITKIQHKDFNVKNPKIFRMLVIRGTLSVLAQSCIYYSVNYASIGILNALFYTSPIISPFIEKILYNTPIHKTHLILTIVSFIGILLILKPPFLFNTNIQDQSSYQFFYLALAGAIFQAVSFIFLHQLKNSIDANVALLHFYVGQNVFYGTMVSSNKLIFDIQNMDIKFILALSCFILISFGTFYLITRAALMKKASYILPFGYVTVIFGFLGDLFIFGQNLDLISVLGMAMASLGLISKLIAINQH